MLSQKLTVTCFGKRITGKDLYNLSLLFPWDIYNTIDELNHKRTVS